MHVRASVGSNLLINGHWMRAITAWIVGNEAPKRFSSERLTDRWSGDDDFEVGRQHG
jgi:hypothetical protein